MSLNRAEMQQTGVEMREHFAASGLTRDELADWLQLDPSAIDHVLEMNGKADPSDVWLVRDALDQTAPGLRWSVLTDSAKGAARQWFRLREVPPEPVV